MGSVGANKGISGASAASNVVSAEVNNAAGGGNLAPSNKERKTRQATKRPAKSVTFDADRNMPTVALKNLKEQNYTITGKLDANNSNFEVGNSFGVRMLGSRNFDVYGRISKVTSSSVTVTVSSGSTYTVPINNVEVSGRELRFRPKDKNARWFGFVDLREYQTADSLGLRSRR